MAHWRYRVDKKIGATGIEFRYGQGCQCSWLKMQVRIPDGENQDAYIRRILSNL